MRRRKAWFAATVGSVAVALVVSACGTSAPSGGGQQPAASGGSSAPAASKPAENKAWAPTQPVEFVVPFVAGGGSDNMARAMLAVIEQEKLVPQPISISNRAGGAGGVGMAYTAGKKGDQHTIMTVNDSIITVPLQDGYNGPTYKDLTPLAGLAMDDFIVVVPAKSPYQTIEDLIKAAKEKPGSLKLGTSAHGGEDHVFGGLIEKAAGVKFTFVPFKGGAEAMTAVVGGHVDIAVPNPNETLSQLEGKLVRALAVGSAQRLPLPALKDVPTLKEKGINVEFQMFRGVAAPPGTPPEVVKFWENVFKKVSESQKWQKEYIERNGLTPAYRNSADFGKLWADSHNVYLKSLKDLGIIK